MKKMELTILVQKGENGYLIGQIQEYPEALSQGKTLDELKVNLKDALTLILDFQKEQLQKEYSKIKVIRRRLDFAI